jgi:hypothetical protein
MLPEEKVAQRFSQIRGIKPPVDVEVLVRELADLEEDSLPGGYDAVTLDKSGRHPRPRVIIEKNQPATRRIFTLGHEIGHIVIPWHYGTDFCRLDSAARLGDRLTADVEAQANHFAAELLMPTKWVERLIKAEAGLENLVEAVKAVGVSYHAASIRLVNLLPGGALFVEMDAERNVVRASASPSTHIRLPEVGKPFRGAELNSLASERVSFVSGSSKIIWWRFPDKIASPKLLGEVRQSSELLRLICDEVFDDARLTTQAMMSINGVIGAANGTILRTGAGDLFTILKRRFLGRGEIAAVVNHRLFEEFLARRVQEIQTRHR